MSKFLLAAVQLNSQQDKKENLEKIKKYIIKATEKGAKLVSFPEGSNYIGDDSIKVAEKIPGGKTFEMISELAKEYKIWIHAGSIYEEKRRQNSLQLQFFSRTRWKIEVEISQTSSI